MFFTIKLKEVDIKLIIQQEKNIKIRFYFLCWLYFILRVYFIFLILINFVFINICDFKFFKNGDIYLVGSFSGFVF